MVNLFIAGRLTKSEKLVYNYFNLHKMYDIKILDDCLWLERRYVWGHVGIKSMCSSCLWFYILMCIEEKIIECDILM